MKVILQDNKKLLKTKLPKEINGNYWLTDANNKNLVNIESDNNRWILKSNNDIKIIDDNENLDNEGLFAGQVNELELSNFVSGRLYDIGNGNEYKFFCLPTYDDTIRQIEINKLTLNNITIGKNPTSTIVVNFPVFADKQIEIVCENGIFKIINYNVNVPMFINDKMVVSSILRPGDYVFILGFSIAIYGNILIFNNPNNLVTFNEEILKYRNIPVNDDVDYKNEIELNVPLYTKKDFFQRIPRIRRVIENKELRIDAPPQMQTNEDMPLILTIGPMMVMGLTSLVSGVIAIIKIRSGEATIKNSITTLVMSGSMLIGMIVFPLIQRFYIKHRTKKKEKIRIKKYTEYINKKQEEIQKELEIERQILLENFVPLNEIKNIIMEKKPNLWERKIDHQDFLSVRLGTGRVNSSLQIEFQDEKFSIVEDKLLSLGKALKDNSKYLNDAPVSINLIENRFTAIVGNIDYLKKYFECFLLQLLTFHSYDMLNVVVLTTDDNKDYWTKYDNIPHFWNRDGSIRFISKNVDEADTLSNFLMEELNNRILSIEESENNSELEKVFLKFPPYYLIITDCISKVKNIPIINTLLDSTVNYGFSLLMLSERLDNLPNETTTFINIVPEKSTIFENELVSNSQKEFMPEMLNIDFTDCYIQLSNIPVDVADGKFDLPTSYSFLEMYDVGNVNQLNIVNRWKESNVTSSLAAPVGINEQGEQFKIDLHEKAHGPHGLVAGMTGSGKSEWIITYILSMCINYHPYEVQFVLIDYKGGGLAGTFENKETGFKLPHLAGTITNLDVAEINRSLASIQSELKRRQKKFNEARDKLGESSIDIYKYQRLYREGKIEEPISHLFIICDEFAELKADQPEFMQQLISTARIGRSLGVHLILATQKPSGVVDDQIWSNSKFRVCLKVQDKGDSNDMIRVPDAAYLKEAGRFYLQVGYNEFFALGQAAYAGSPYYESDKHKTVANTDIEFLTDTGQSYKTINTEKEKTELIYKGEELPFILKSIDNVAKELNINIRQLWLDAIPKDIYILDLIKKYGYKKENFILNPVIGEYDAPAYQKQGLLTLPLSKKGNTLIYGMANSGKEDLLTTIMYSMMINYVADEVNIYAIDCGAETLNSFRNSPIVGDVISSSDPGKLTNLIKKILKELEERKDKFKDYNGDYYYYITHQKEKIPNIVIIINNYDAFTEVFEGLDDVLIKMTREGEKLGIYFIITALASNSVKYKLSQNFKQSLVMQMTDAMDYRTILNNVNKVVPSSIKGRGIVDIGEVFEFQSAKPSNAENMTEFINEVSLKLHSTAKSFAPSVPVLPKIVNYDFISTSITDLTQVPIGVERETLEISKMNFVNKNFVISTNDEEALYSFTGLLFKVIDSSKDATKKIIINSLEQNIDGLTQTTLFKENFEMVFKQLYEFASKKPELKILVLINGVSILTETTIGNLLNSIMNLKNINVVLIDLLEKLKEIKILELYRNVDNKAGIWISNGIQDQSIIALRDQYNKDLREEMPFFAGYAINNGKYSKIKLLQSKTNVDE